MKEKLNALIDIQALESEANRLSAWLEKIPEKIDALDAGFVDVQQKLFERTESLKALKKAYRDKEADVEMILSRIEKSRERMDAVKTNKEYQSILKEIQDLEEKNSKIEDDMIADLDRIDIEENDLEQLKIQMSHTETAVASQKASVNKEAAELSQRLETVKQQLDERYRDADAKMLETFNRVKIRVGTSVVVPVTNAVCNGCHLTIPPQMFNELYKQDSLKFCPHCHRIIYWLAEK